MKRNSLSQAPRISVVLTVFNVEDYLCECMDSILSQTFTDYELLCINDGSTDGSESILRDYAQSDSRVHVFSQANTGVAAARNRGIVEASGEYLMLLDADDVFEPKMMELLFDKAVALQADVVTCSSCELDNCTGEIVPMPWALKLNHIPEKEPFDYLDCKGCLFEAFMGWPWDKLYRTSFIRDNNLVFPIIPNSEDLVFVYEALLAAKSMGVVKESLVRHRVNRTGSVSNSRLGSPRSFYDASVLLKEFLLETNRYNGLTSWGFLNWFLDYTLWNVRTLPFGEERCSLLTSLFEGDFTALELDTHVIEYYALYPLTAEYFDELRNEYDGKPHSVKDDSQTQANCIVDFLSRGFRSLRQDGFIATAKKVLERD